MSQRFPFEASSPLSAADTASSSTEPAPPAWVADALRAASAPLDVGPQVQGVVSGDLALLKVTVGDAARCSGETLREGVASAYRRIAASLDQLARQPIRFWNFIPELTAPIAPGIDRYMAFNAGRHDAFSTPSACGRTFRQPWATASAVGSTGADLVVYCLAAATPSTAVENPRQTSAWLYSPRYGPLPPCFSRATIATIDGRVRLLIGGTASIVGEDSRHPVHAAAQLEETLENLGALVAAARGVSETGDRALAQVTDVRAYVPDDADAATVRHEVSRRLVRARRLEIVRARLCRPELLLEIEALADM
jgi:chorismate lyase/3-hydroxybenzoate synthase